MSKPNSFLVAVEGKTNRHSGLISELLAVMRTFNFRRLWDALRSAWPWLEYEFLPWRIILLWIDFWSSRIVLGNQSQVCKGFTGHCTVDIDKYFIQLWSQHTAILQQFCSTQERHWRGWMSDFLSSTLTVDLSSTSPLQLILGISHLYRLSLPSHLPRTISCYFYRTFETISSFISQSPLLDSEDNCSTKYSIDNSKLTVPKFSRPPWQHHLHQGELFISSLFISPTHIQNLNSTLNNLSIPLHTILFKNLW